MKVTLGGDRVGSGNKMKVNLHDWSRSSHNLSRAWRSSLTPGVVYPCFIEPALDKDTFDIDVESLVRTIPTLAPIYGGFKMQIEIGFYPDRLAVGALHGNAVNVGLNMSKVKYPQMILPKARWSSFEVEDSYFQRKGISFKHASVSTSSLLHYLGIMSLPISDERTDGGAYVEKNAVPLLAYWDWMKNYHCNKQEKNAYVLQGRNEPVYTLGMKLNGTWTNSTRGKSNPRYHFLNHSYYFKAGGQELRLYGTWKATPVEDPRTGKTYYKAENLNMNELCLEAVHGSGEYYNINRLFNLKTPAGTTANLWKPNDAELAHLGFPSGYDGEAEIFLAIYESKNLNEMPPEIAAGFVDSEGRISVGQYGTTTDGDAYFQKTDRIVMVPFPLSNIDKAREQILSAPKVGDAVAITTESTATGYTNTINFEPYLTVVDEISELNPDGSTRDIVPQNAFPLNGLGVKCYLSDRFNNWLRTEWLDGENGIKALTAVDTSTGSFTIDTLILQKKIYNVLTREAVSDGTYRGWKEANWGYSSMQSVESPIFLGGASWDIEFDEVVSTAESGNKPLGSLGGRGNAYRRKNGHIKYKCEESGYIMGFISITPRLDYSEGEKWWYEQLKTPNDLHKAGLDEIGFQELPLREMAGWVSNGNLSAGKQLSWQHYMTALNECHGDFADEKKAMYMTLNRRYEEEMVLEDDGRKKSLSIKDLTTYVDPSKYNYAFADQSITAQNFWVQLGIKCNARRVMSANQMPNL